MTRNQSLPYSKALLFVLGVTPMGLVPNGVIPFGLIPIAMVPWEAAQLSSGQAHAQSRDPVVTSDTSAYCEVLMDRITGITRATAAPPPTAAAMLSEEGERMCVHGQIRAGILRLRRALEIMRHGDD